MKVNKVTIISMLLAIILVVLIISVSVRYYNNYKIDTANKQNIIQNNLTIEQISQTIKTSLVNKDDNTLRFLFCYNADDPMEQIDYDRVIDLYIQNYKSYDWTNSNIEIIKNQIETEETYPEKITFWIKNIKNKQNGEITQNKFVVRTQEANPSRQKLSKNTCFSLHSSYIR
jgi:hypothetical protein